MMQAATALSNFFQSTIGDKYDPKPQEMTMGSKVTLVARKVLGFGIYTTVSWALCWMKPRVAPLGFMAGFIFRDEVQNKMDELYKLTPAKSKVTVSLIATSILVSGVVTLPVLVPVVLLGTSVVMGKIGRDLLYPPQSDKND